jgi:hypothetical protein
MQRNGVVECAACRSRLVVPSPRSVSRAYDKHHNKITSKFRALKFLLVVGDCMLVGLQVRFQLSPFNNYRATTLSAVQSIARKYLSDVLVKWSETLSAYLW